MSKRETRKPRPQRDEQGSNHWSDNEWEAERRRRSVTGFGRRGGYGVTEPEDDFYRNRGLDRTEHAARDTGAPREGRRQHFDRQPYGDSSYSGYGEESYEETPYMRERPSPARDGDILRERGRARPERFGQYQSGYQGAYEESSRSDRYGSEGGPEENAYYEDLDEGSAYGHGQAYEGSTGNPGYSLDAGFTTGASPGGLARGEFYGRGPRGYTRSDERIREDVCDRLSAHGRIDASEIEVTVEAGEVTLEGHVPSRPMKHQIENVADSVLGVKDIHNRLRIGRAGSSKSQPTTEGAEPHNQSN
jgi:hypothetical protein